MELAKTFLMSAFRNRKGKGEQTAKARAKARAGKGGEEVERTADVDAPRLPVGCKVRLAADCYKVQDTELGPLMPGDIGVLRGDDQSDCPYQVEAPDGTQWHYRPAAIEQVQDLAPAAPDAWSDVTANAKVASGNSGPSQAEKTGAGRKMTKQEKALANLAFINPGVKAAVSLWGAGAGVVVHQPNPAAATSRRPPAGTGLAEDANAPRERADVVVSMEADAAAGVPSADVHMQDDVGSESTSTTEARSVGATEMDTPEETIRVGAAQNAPSAVLSSKARRFAPYGACQISKEKPSGSACADAGAAPCAAAADTPAGEAHKESANESGGASTGAAASNADTAAGEARTEKASESGGADAGTAPCAVGEKTPAGEVGKEEANESGGADAGAAASAAAADTSAGEAGKEDDMESRCDIADRDEGAEDVSPAAAVDMQPAHGHTECGNGVDAPEIESGGALDVSTAAGNPGGGACETEMSTLSAAADTSPGESTKNDAAAGRGEGAGAQSCGAISALSSGDAVAASTPQIVRGLRDEVRNSGVDGEGVGSKSAAAHGLLALGASLSAFQKSGAGAAGTSVGKQPKNADEVSSRDTVQKQDLWMAQQLQRLQVMHIATNSRGSGRTSKGPRALALRQLLQSSSEEARVDWKRMYRSYLWLSVLSFGDAHPPCSLRPHHLVGTDSCCRIAHAYGCQSVFDRDLEFCSPPDADAGGRTGGRADRFREQRQKMNKLSLGDCTAIAGALPQPEHPRTRMQAPMDGPDGFSSGMHFFEIISKAVLQESGAETEGASFTVGIVSNSRRPNGIFLGSEPATGVAGFGFGYQGGRAQVMSTGCELRDYGCKFSAGDTIGVLLDADAGVISFFVNDVGQGVAFEGQDFNKMRKADKQEWNFRPAVGLYTPGVQVSLRHRSATRHALPPLSHLCSAL